MKCHDVELKRARAETQNRINKNVHLIRQLQGNSCVIKNKTRGEVGTMLQQAEQEATAAVSKQLTNKNRQAVAKHTPSKMAELALLDSNKKMRLIEEVVARHQREQVAIRITTKTNIREGAEAEDNNEMPGSNRNKVVEGGDSECHAKLEAMGQQITKLEAELDAARKELVVKAREFEVAEEEGWISSKLKFSEIAARTEEEAERDSWNAEFSRELIEAQTKLKDTEKELAESENQLQKARVSWNETTSKEKEKLRDEILELRRTTERLRELEEENTPDDARVSRQVERGAMEENMEKVSQTATELAQNVAEWMADKTKEITSLTTKCKESAAETEKLTTTQTEMESKRRALQDKLEEQVSETKEVRDNNEELQKINRNLKDEGQATRHNTRESQEAHKQLKQMLERKVTELKENRDTIDRQCRDIGEVRRTNSVTEAAAAEKIAQLEATLRQKDREVEEARYQPPPRSEWLLQGRRLTHTIRKIYTNQKIGSRLRPTVCVYTRSSGAMERFQADTEQELNRGLREMVREEMSSTKVCSNEEAAQIVQGNDGRDAVEWVVSQRDAMEKMAAVWDCEQGDAVTIKVETGDDDRPVRLVQGTVTKIPDKVLTGFRQKTAQEVIAIDDNEYQVNALISIQQTPGNGEWGETDSPGRESAPATPGKQKKQRRKEKSQGADSPSFRNGARERGSYSDPDSSDMEAIHSSRRHDRLSPPAVPKRQRWQGRKEKSQEVDSPSFQNGTREYGSYSDSDSSDGELIHPSCNPIRMSPPAVPMTQPGSTPSSPNKSTWSGGSMTMATATAKELDKHNALVQRAQQLKVQIEKADMRTEDGKREFRETWRQVASPAYMYGPSIPLWSLASLLKAICPVQHKMNSVVDKIVKEDDQNPGMYEFRDTEGSGKGSFKKQLCNKIYKEMTGTSWEDMVKVEKRNLWKKVRSTGDSSLLREYMEQTTEDLMEQAAFTDRKRFEQAVTSTVRQIGWETHSSVIQNAAALRTIFAGEGTSREIADKFRERILKMYDGVLRMHESAITFCVEESAIINSDPAYEETVKWLTVDYIGQHLYDLISMKNKKDWGLEEQRYGRGGQSRSATKNRYTAQQVDHRYTEQQQQIDENSDYELAEALRSEGVSSDERWKEMCGIFQAEIDAAEAGHNTLYDEEGRMHPLNAQGASMWSTIMNVENRMVPEKRTFFRSDERPERIHGASYGYRGQPTPNPESAESMEYCKQINWSQMSEEDITEMLCQPCEDHPVQPGQEINHLNFQCCSCFHRMRYCIRMLIPAGDKIRDWRDLANANSETRKKARFDMQRRADEAMKAQTWVPDRVMREIEQRNATRDAKRFKKR